LPDGKVYDSLAGTVTDPKTGQVWTVPSNVQFDPATNQFFQIDRPPGLEGLPDDQFRRNWSFENGWSSTPYEVSQMPDAPGWVRDLMRADSSGTTTLGFPMKEGNWYLFGGLIDLGSPENPGAGTGHMRGPIADWITPDRIGPYRMNDYFVLHDWLF